MKILVLGGAGCMGNAIVRDLLESSKVSEVIVGDIDISKAEMLIKELNNPKVTTAYVNAADHSVLVKALKDVDVLVNATWYYFNVLVMEAAIEAKVHYLDLGGLYHKTLEQLKLSERVKGAGLTHILGMGASPGITNVLARHGAERLDDVEEIHIRAGQVGGGISYSIRTIIDELTMRPVIYENGEFKYVDPLTGEEIIEFPEPVGRVKAYYSLHSEIATLPYNIKGVKTVDFKVAFHPDIYSDFKVLNKLGFTSTEPIKVGEVTVKPRDVLFAILSSMPYEPTETFALRVTVTGRRKSKKTECIFELVAYPRKDWKAGGVAVATGVSASIVAQMLGSGEIEIKGAVPPEVCIDPNPFIQELAKRNLKVMEKPEECL